MKNFYSQNESIQIEDRREKEAAAAAAKKQKQLAAARKKVDDAVAAMVAPGDFFRLKGSDFGVAADSVGADGLPAKDAAGEELTKSALKKLKKSLDKAMEQKTNQAAEIAHLKRSVKELQQVET